MLCTSLNSLTDTTCVKWGACANAPPPGSLYKEEELKHFLPGEDK